ncbi:pyroglutamyl-peptidase I [Roseateles sp. DC23W]|uniref:Pyrrolidone-carboxylate peptidase n=1 Tax=Pelomonas dachongensis TaxID=3299029 RepID=A0ABW7EJH0_9BURK
MDILITGFEPFDGDTVNPSWEVAQALDGRVIGIGRVRACRLPVTFRDAPQRLAEALAQGRPELVIALGQASGRSEISIERVAVNLIDARIPDNAGDRPHDARVVALAPDAYFSTLPVKAMRDGLRAAGYPAGLSLTAGAFVCNQLFFELQHRLAGRGVRGGFIHLPALPEQAARAPGGLPSMGLAAQIDAIALAVAIAMGEVQVARGADEGAPTG